MLDDIADDADGFFSDEQIDSAVAVLREHGPLTKERFLALLIESGTDLGEDPAYTADELLRMLEVDSPAAELADERWLWVPSALDRRTFTHRLTAVEVEHDLISMSVDLAPLVAVADHEEYQLLADGTEFAVMTEVLDSVQLRLRGASPALAGEMGVLSLPNGYLADHGLRAGDTIGLRLEGDTFVLAAMEPGRPSRDQLRNLWEPIQAALEREPGDDPVELSEPVWMACLNDAELFGEPLPPLGELLAEGEFVCDDGLVAPAGFDFEAWWLDRRVDELRNRYRFDRDEALVVLALTHEFDRIADLPPAEMPEIQPGLRGGLAALADPALAQALLFETIGAGLADAEILVRFTHRCLKLAPRQGQPALLWLSGKAWERMGEIELAERGFRDAETVDPMFPLALEELARYAGDRGDAVGALALLRRAGVPDDDGRIQLLQRFQPAPRTDLGRNQPCWCGSGRKYKQCHLHREAAPLEERALWLYRKAEAFIMEGGPWRTAVMEIAVERSYYDEAPLALLDALDDPLCASALLFEGRGLEEFLQIRGALLPEDELLLAQRWLLSERSVYELQENRPGQGFTLRDVRTGDVHEVRERTASTQLRAGLFLCARILRTGDTEQIFGGLEPVPLRDRDALIELLDTAPEPVELVAFLSRRFAPPVLRNTDGEPMVFVETTLRAKDVSTLARKLDETYERADGKPARWHDLGGDDGRTVRATFILDGDRLLVNTIGEARMDRALDTLRELDPSITVLDRSRHTPDDAAGGPPTGPLDPTDPAVREALAAVMREHEERWVNESIPALSGMTPHDAAADPTRREDLVQLLNSLPPNPEGDPTRMSPERLRAALGLD